MTLRVFLAIPIPEVVQRGLRELQSGVPGARWSLTEQIHLTLRFIGDVDGRKLDLISENLRSLDFEPFMLELEGTGYFPSSGPARVLWAGVLPCNELMDLQSQLERRLVEAAGLERERRNFHPHVTLARLGKVHEAKVRNWLEYSGGFAAQDPFRVDSFGLYSSILSPQGAKYQLLEEFPCCGEIL